MQVALHSFLSYAAQVTNGVYILPPDADGRIYIVNTLLGTCVYFKYADWADYSIVEINQALDENCNMKALGKAIPLAFYNSGGFWNLLIKWLEDGCVNSQLINQIIINPFQGFFSSLFYE